MKAAGSGTAACAGDVRKLLPAETPTVSPMKRERIIRERRAAYQQRPLW